MRGRFPARARTPRPPVSTLQQVSHRLWRVERRGIWLVGGDALIRPEDHPGYRAPRVAHAPHRRPPQFAVGAEKALAVRRGRADLLPRVEPRQRLAVAVGERVVVQFLGMALIGHVAAVVLADATRVAL